MIANRILAAVADAQQAIKFLEELGFRGLRFKSSEEDMIKYWYSGYDQAKVTQYLGDPKSIVKSIRYDFGAHGTVAIWPNNKVVVLKNSERRLPSLKPEPVKPIPNPAAHTGLVPIPDEFAEEYNRYRNRKGTEKQMLDFNKRLWHAFNKMKFGGVMHEPKFALMPVKDRMKTLGRWTPSRRLLEIGARHYFGLPELFVETFLHEMCHQAVSEIDKADEHAFDQGHGPKWKSWMLHVGLKPSIKSYEAETSFMNTSEKTRLKDQTGVDVDKALPKQEMITQLGLKRITPVNGQRVYVPQLKTLVSGTAICMADEYGTKWAVLTDAQLNHVMAVGIPSLRYSLIPRFEIFNNPDPKPINQVVLAKVVERVTSYYTRILNKRY